MHRARYFIIFLFALGWFVAFQTWGSFADPDAFYHAKMASLMLEQGFIREFPWLDLTSFNQPFANHHFLFHVLLLPFVKIFGMLLGNQIAAVSFAAGFSTLFYFLLRSLKIRRAEFWTALLIVIPPMILRLSLAKASPLAIAFTCLGVVALLKRKPIWGALAGALLVLTHGGWPLMLLLQGAALVGMVLFDLVVTGKSLNTLWSEERALKFRSYLGTFTFTSLGALVGLLLHPYITTLLPFLWIQIVKIGIATPFDRVSMGQEWYPYEIGNLVRGLAPAIVLAVATVYGLLMHRHSSLDLGRARQVIALLIPTGALFILTLKSMRFVEYFAPLLILLLATLAELVDWKAVRSEARKLNKGLSFVITVLVCAMFFRGALAAWFALRRSDMPFNQYSQAMQAVARVAKPDSRIFNSDWSIFPQLFVLDDRYRYISGLDPTFLLEANPELSDAYTEFRLGKATSSAYDLIRGRTGSDVAVIERKNYEHIIEALKFDPRFKLIYEDEEAFVFLVE